MGNETQLDYTHAVDGDFGHVFGGCLRGENSSVVIRQHKKGAAN